jgi:hypothetical protein
MTTRNDRDQQTARNTSNIITRLLDRPYEQITRPILTAIANQTQSGTISQRLRELDAEATRLNEANEPLRPDNAILRATLADLSTALGNVETLVDSTAPQITNEASSSAGIAQRQLALPNMTDNQLRAIGIAWNRPDPDAVAQLVMYSNSETWRSTLRRDLNETIIDAVQQTAIRGIVSGQNPLATARKIRALSESLPAHRANTTMRTLQLTAYRDATVIHQNANRALISRVIRIATLDQRTCLACIAQHGDVLYTSDNPDAPIPRVNDHHNGRCTSIIEVRGRTLNIQSGEAWFASLPESRQRQQASFLSTPGKYEAYQNGEATLRDFVQPYTSPTFGEMVREAPLKSLTE